MNKKANILDDSIVVAVGRARRVIANAINKKIAEAGHDLTIEQLVLIKKIGEQEGIKQQDLANSIFKEKATITRALNKMEQKNILVRVADKEDKRQKLIYLTHKGKELKEILMPIVLEVSKEAEKGIKKKDLKFCRELMNKIVENII